MEATLDLFAIFIFLGVVQAVFLSLFFFSKESRKNQFNVFHGFMLVCIAGCLLEIFLMYTGYILHVLHLVDFSETLALLIGPFLYLYVLSLSQGKIGFRSVAVHLIFPAVYLLAQIPFLITPEDVKYNAWAVAYHPDWTLRHWRVDYDPWMFVLTEWHTELVLLSLAFYTAIGSVVIVKAFREKGQSFWNPETYSLRMIRDAVVQIASFLALIIVIKIFNENDTGDHLFAAFASLLVYATSFSVIRNSNFFKQIPIAEDKKYKGSNVDAVELDRLALAIQQIMREQKPYSSSAFNLPTLAQLVKSSTHTVSQVINEKFGKSFFEWVAEYRVDDAKKILKDAPHLKIEEVAEQVGYNSKSSFNTVFKKITGKTPSEYRAG